MSTSRLTADDLNPTPALSGVERMRRALSISMAALAVFASMLLGMGQEEVVRPLLTLALAVPAIYFADIKKIFALNRTVANIAAVGAVALSLYDFAQFDRDQQLLAIANLLIYLQLVVLFQQKTVRVYWQLVMLSLLQVVVAAALNFSVLFGLLLTLYMFLSLATLMLFFVYRETLRVLPEGEFAAAAPRGEPRMTFATSEAGEWQTVRHRMRLGRTAGWMGTITLLITVLIFLIVPRYGDGAWRGSVAGGINRTVGFSQRVQLGQLGEVSEDPGVVMRLRLEDVTTDEILKLHGEPLLRGAICTTYANRQWSHGALRYRNKVESLDDPVSRRGMVRQSITLEPLNEPVVFSIYPAYRLDERIPVMFDIGRDQLVRSPRAQQMQMNFELGTTGIRDGHQYPFTAQPGPLTSYETAQLLQLPSRRNDSDPLRTMKEIARQEVAKAQVNPDDHYLVTQALLAFLRANGDFRYSLQPVERDRTLDPVEDFVVNNRTGHCEYFASALVLMLRSQGVPARLVIGYKGGEYNPIGGFYQFRQLHAHAWVEAYLAPEQLADRKIELFERNTHGAWLRLDPTVDSLGDEEMSLATGVLASMGQMLDYVEMLWVRNVVGMNSEQQQRNIYDPMSDGAHEVVRQLFGEPDPNRPWTARLAELFAAGWRWLQGNWFSWQGGLAAMAICTLAVAARRFVWPWLRRKRRGRAAPRRVAQAARVEFYQRLEALLARQGYRRPPGQTQREFATAAGGQLAETSRLRPAAALPRALVDAFYRVRFGQRPLSPEEAQQIDAALRELETALEQG